MIVRVRAELHFAPSGNPNRVRDRNLPRLARAQHLKEGTAAEELSFVEVDGLTLRANFFFDVTDPDQADDVDDIVEDLTEPDLVSELADEPRSWVDRHDCEHEAVDPGPCEAPVTVLDVGEGEATP